MLYTGKGDKGSTTHFGSARRVSKTDPTIEALGTLDELGALLGVCKTKTSKRHAALVEELQHDLFTIQAELAGAAKQIGSDRTEFLGATTDAIEKLLPPIRTFFIAGTNERSAFFDLARTLARRAERRIVALHRVAPLRDEVLSYMNRLSSILYALARREAHKSGIKEKPPKYRQ